MESYAAVLNYAIPFFVALLLIEALIAWWKGAKVVRSMDTLSSLSSGLTNIIKDVLGLTVVIVSYDWLVGSVGLFEIESTLLTYVLAFIGLDFAGYWIHRLSHSVNYFWNRHIIHHSSEEFNLGCALRQSISSFVAITVFFLLPIAILGVPGEVVAIVAPLHLFAQYWYHTRLINRLGILEYILVTPSHHRVHHAINKEYLDKNLSQVFIIWDKLFGTFQEELVDVPPVYGVTRPVRTWNPIIINFVHLWQLITDAWRTNSWKAKFTIWFKPTGWRPEDVKAKYPVKGIEDPYHYEKYDPKVSRALQWWSWIQFTAVFSLMMYLFNHLADIGAQQSIVYGLFLVLCIFSYSMLMDKSRYSLAIEVLKSLIGLAFIFLQGNWFGMPAGFSALVAAYFLLSIGIVAYFSFSELKKDEAPLKAF
ncbi:MAG: sterol desaturase family protein [Mameliella sp.]|nr:sterol desaturase family protein [Phaeodactylibacter sp.]